MSEPFRHSLSVALAVALLTGCATTEPVGPKEGQVVLQAGRAPSGASDAEVVPGPKIRRLAVLAPGVDPAWGVNWQETDKKPKGTEGAYTGLLTGLMLIQSVPFLVGFWPAALGVVASTTAMGAFGTTFETQAFVKMAADDRATIVQAASELKADHLLREAAAAALAARTGKPPLTVLWYPTSGPDTQGTDPLSDARERGADGILNISLDVFGLAMGEDTDTFGVFVRVRARLVNSAEGELRYERIFEYGPGHPLPGMPRPATYTLEFLAVDQARVFRHETEEAIRRVAGIVAADPALPLAAR